MRATRFGTELTFNKSGEAIYAWIRACEASDDCFTPVIRPRVSDLQNAYNKFVGRPISQVTLYKVWKDYLGHGFQYPNSSPVHLVYCLTFWPVFNSQKANDNWFDKGNSVIPAKERQQLSAEKLLDIWLSLKKGQYVMGPITSNDLDQRKILSRSYWFGNINKAYQICKTVSQAVKEGAATNAWEKDRKRFLRKQMAA